MAITTMMLKTLGPTIARSTMAMMIAGMESWMSAAGRAGNRFSPVIACKQTEDDTQRAGDKDREKADDQGDPSAVENPAEDIAPRESAPADNSLKILGAFSRARRFCFSGSLASGQARRSLRKRGR